VITSIAAEIGSTLERLRAGYARRSVILADVQGRCLRKMSASSCSGARCANCTRRTRSYVLRVRFRQGEARPPLRTVRAFINRYRHIYGVEQICKVTQVAPSGYLRHHSQQYDPVLRCARVQCDDVLTVDIERIWQANLPICGTDEVLRQL